MIADERMREIEKENEERKTLETCAQQANDGQGAMFAADNLAMFTDKHSAHPVITELLAEVRELLAEWGTTMRCEWGTTKRCGTCAYWKRIKETTWGVCGSNVLEWQEDNFCCDWTSEEIKCND